MNQEITFKIIMERLRISRKLQAIKYVLAAVILFSIYILWMYYNDAETVLACSAISAISAALFYLIHNAKTVEFDDNYMYITGREIDKAIPLDKIFKIKLTTININDQNMWKIGYLDGEIEKAIRILPRLMEFAIFKQVVSAKNQGVAIKNFSHTFDFDQ